MSIRSNSSFPTTRVPTNGLELAVATTGPDDGPPVVLLHGWPHTRELWRPVAQLLGDNRFRVIVPDLRRVGDSDRPEIGYDVATVSADVIGLLDAFDIRTAAVVGIDAGVASAFFAALTCADRVSRLVVMEGLLPGLPGAEDFLSAGPPWWFGFHSVPGLAERVVVGNEAAYLGWFLEGPSVRHDIGAQARSAFVRAYSGTTALRAGFEYYRAAPRNAELLAAALSTRRVTTPTLALAGGIVGNALTHQLVPVADDLTCEAVADCGHVIPLEKPTELADAITRFLAADAPLVRTPGVRASGSTS